MSSETLNKSLDIKAFRLFIFDLDGTLYDQQKLRRIMLFSLLKNFMLFKTKQLDLKIIDVFRKEREKHKGYASPRIGSEQYQWCADSLNIPAERVKKTIEFWMLRFPLNHLFNARYPDIERLFDRLKKEGKTIIIYSDFPSEEKIKALGLFADGYFCSTDPEIAQLKPGKKALEWICQAMNHSLDNAILIGDRDDTDGESARMAGMNYLIIDRTKAKEGSYFRNLIKQFGPQHE